MDLTLCGTATDFHLIIHSYSERLTHKTSTNTASILGLSFAGKLYDGNTSCTGQVLQCYPWPHLMLASEQVHTTPTWAASREKVPNVLCRCHTKRRMGACSRAHPSFGMTTIKDIRDLFVWCSPYVLTATFIRVIYCLLVNSWAAAERVPWFKVISAISSQQHCLVTKDQIIY